MKQELNYKLDELPEVVAKLSEQLKNQSVVALIGELGAGKTTLVKALLKAWGVTEDVTSPTFTYVNCYQNAAGKRFFHFDLYRISKLDDFLSQGFDEYLQQSNALCLIEWPQVIKPLLKSGYSCLRIEHSPGDGRKMVVLTGQMEE